ncbi:MAG: hypothetical protein KAW93_01175, partial [Methanogenium sp.]|nr:hypothetical protein [Methanogenium sp.]
LSMIRDGGDGGQEGRKTGLRCYWLGYYSAIVPNVFFEPMAYTIRRFTPPHGMLYKVFLKQLHRAQGLLSIV